ncbi:MAG: hypothetical protein ACOCV1_03565 [Bacillota bacterium]
MEYKYKKSDMPSGRILLDIVGKDDNKRIMLKPDPDQSAEGKNAIHNFINNNLIKDDGLKIGMVSYDIDEWKKPGGAAQKFIDAIKKSKSFISWKDNSEDKKIMKGLNAIIPKNQSFPGSGSFMPPAGGFQNMPGAGIPGASLNTFSAPGSDMSNIPSPTPPPSPEGGETKPEHKELSMKNLIILWESALNEI